MSQSNHPFREKDNALFKNLLGFLSPQGKSDAEKRHKKSGKELRGLWEGYHFLAFGNEICEQVGKKILDDALYQQGWNSFDAFREMPSNNNGFTIRNNKSEKIFQCFADTQGISLLQCFVQFLEYCRDNRLPLSIYKNREPEGIIKDIRDYIDKRDQEYTNRKSLQVSWEDNANQGKLCIVKEVKTLHAEHLQIKDFKDSKNYNNVSSLLNCNANLTDFIGRKKELDQLRFWAEDAPTQRSVKVIYGEGGVGKTRLAFHFSKLLRKQKWEAGEACLGINRDWLTSDKGTLIIIDYPEDKKELLRQFLIAIRDMPQDSTLKLRILLLTRNPQYVDDVLQDVQILHDQLPISLAGLENKELQWELMISAWNELSTLKLQSSGKTNSIDEYSPLPIDEKSFFKWQEQENSHSTPLIVLALAIYFSDMEVDIVSQDDIVELRGERIIRYLSKREVTRIQNEVIDFNRDPANQFDGTSVNYRAILLVKAMATISNGLDFIGLRNLIDALAFNDTQHYRFEPNHIVELSLWSENELNPITPNILAADFLSYCLNKWAVGCEGQWIFASMGFSEKGGIKTDGNELIANFLRLGRIIYDVSSTENQRYDLSRALCLYIDTNSHIASWIAENIMMTDQLELHTKMLISAAANTCLRTSELDRPTEVKYHCFVGKYYHDIHKYDQSLSAFESAGAIASALYKNNKSSYLDMYLSVLDCYATVLSSNDNTEKAADISKVILNAFVATPAEESYKYYDLYASALERIYEGPLRQDDDNLENSLLEALNNIVACLEKHTGGDNERQTAKYAEALIHLSLLLSKTDRIADALQETSKAVDIYTRLYHKHPIVYKPTLVKALHHQSLRFEETGEMENAEAARKQQVKLAEELAREVPRLYKHSLYLTALNWLYNLLFNRGKKEEALDVCMLQVKEYHDAPGFDWPKYGALYIDALVNMSNLLYEKGELFNDLPVTDFVLGDLQSITSHSLQHASSYNLVICKAIYGYIPIVCTHDKDNAIDVITTIAEIFKNLDKNKQTFHLLLYAKTLVRLSECEVDDHEYKKSLGTALRAVAIFELSQEVDIRHEVDYAHNLHLLSIGLSHTADINGSLCKAQESVNLLEKIVSKDQSEVNRVALAKSLNNLHFRQKDIGDIELSINSTKESVLLYEALAATNPEQYKNDLDGMLGNLSNLLFATQKNSTHFSHHEIAIETYERLSKKTPSVYKPELLAQLNHLAIKSEEFGDIDEAIILRDKITSLSQDNPDYKIALAQNLSKLVILHAKKANKNGLPELIQHLIQISREIVEINPDGFLRDLATDLSNLPNKLADITSPDIAIFYIRESIDIWEILEKSGDHLRMAGLLTNFASILENSGNHEEALDISKKSVLIIEGLPSKVVNRAKSFVARCLLNHIIWVSKSSNGKNDLKLCAETTLLYRDLQSEDAGKFINEFKQSLSFLAICLSQNIMVESEPDSCILNILQNIRVGVVNPGKAGVEIPFDPEFTNYIFTLAFVLSLANKQKESLEVFKLAIDRLELLQVTNPSAYKPMLTQVLRAYIMVLLDFGDYKEARKIIAKFIEYF